MLYFCGEMLGQLSFEDREDDLRLRECWQSVLDQVASYIPAKMAERFIYSLQAGELRDGLATIEAPSAFNSEWVRSRFANQFAESLGEALGEQIRVEFRVCPTERKPSLTTEISTRIQPAVFDGAGGVFTPMENYRFDTFVEGPSNRLALAGARAVAAEPGKKFNPLFIYGPSGLGKTHLLHAIAKEMQENNPRYPVVYVSAQQFTEDLIRALQDKKVDQFRKSQRNVGLWLVDDIQFVAGKDRTQEEIFHIFNSLQQSGRAIVLCSDRPPRDLRLFDERLRSRFESGLVADIQLPDLETRCAILLSKAKIQGVPFDAEIALFLATHIPGTIRELEGAMIRIAAQASLYNQDITMEFVQKVVDESYESAVSAKPTFNQILHLVSKHYRIPVEDIKGTSRKAPVALARHLAVYLTREVNGDSYHFISEQFGGRDHTSMMHAHKKITHLASEDRDFGNVVRSLMRNLNGGG
jgi:chromosomal replication initiator protein